ncbi:MAG: pyridoxal phosphate-dependent aminotransferase [Caldisericaceae bacterium]|nr:pyridoxal phosphate-dependent aminotransferase [Caldisericaceae bacterium]
MLSERIKHIGISPTMKIAAKAIAMRAQGIDVVDFSVGEPDFPTPQFIKEAGKQAIDQNITKYTMNSGTVELRKAIAENLYKEYGLSYEINQILVTNGAKQAIFNSIMAIISDGDEVIIPAPYWVSYPEMVRLAGGRPVIVETHEENGFRLTAEQLKQAISASTRAFILCNPSNPTGAAYGIEELQELAKVLEEEEIFIIADEIYSKLVYDNFRFNSFATLSPKLKERTILVNGFSKAFSMTGWRIGYLAGPKEIVDAANKIQSHSTSNANSISQYAALQALKGPSYEINRMVAEFQKRRNYVLQQLSSIPDISVNEPEGTFYVFPNISAYFGKEHKGHYIRNSYGLAYYLLREANVVVVPGAAFGSDKHIRISYSTSMEQIEKGMKRIAQALRQLKTPKQVKFVQLNNYKTKIQKAVPVETDLNLEQRAALVAEAEAHLKFDQYFEWNANINGLIIQLRTNQSHLNDFWMENWYPAQLESDLEPHGVIYAVDGVVGREAHAFYHADSATGILFNSDYYASLRSLALSMVSDLGERKFDLHTVRGFSGDFQGRGFALIGPKGTKKTPVFYQLLQREGLAWHSNDLLFVRFGGGFAAADVAERKFYLPTQHAEYWPSFASLFEKCKCENVVTDRVDCENQQCEMIEQCAMDRGLPYCFTASKKSAAMLDPYWLGGMERHVKRIDLQMLILLTADPLAEPVKKLEAEQALTILSQGASSGPSLEAQAKNQPFYNPHLIVKDELRLKQHQERYLKLLQMVNVFQINTAGQTAAQIAERILYILGSES